MPDEIPKPAHRPAQAAQSGNPRWRLEPMDQNTPKRRELRTRNPIRPPDSKGDGRDILWLLAVAVALAAFVVACDQVAGALR
jgi:hypothetical protein